jgi:hypothetical protein
MNGGWTDKPGNHDSESDADTIEICNDHRIGKNPVREILLDWKRRAGSPCPNSSRMMISV